MTPKTHGSAVLEFPAVVKFPAAFLVLPRPGSSRVATDPVGSYPTGALPVVIGSCFIASSTSAKRQIHFFFVFHIIIGTLWVGHHYCRLQYPVHKGEKRYRNSIIRSSLYGIVVPGDTETLPCTQKPHLKDRYELAQVNEPNRGLLTTEADDGHDREIVHGWSQWSTFLCRSSNIP